MAIKRISDLSSILCVGTSNSSGAISCLTIQQGVERDILNKNENGRTIENEEDNDKETFKLKEALFEVSWPFGEAPSGYTNFESRSISYWALSGYITHNILHETYTFAGNKKFTNSISVGEKLTVSGSVWLGDSTDNNTGDDINITGKQLSVTATSVYNNIGEVSSTLSGNLNLNLSNTSKANISISNYDTSMTTSNVGRLDINSNIVTIRTNTTDTNGETGYFDVRGYDQDLSASHHVVMHTPSSFIRIGYNEPTSHNFSSGDMIDLSSQNIELTYSRQLIIYCVNPNDPAPSARIPVLTFGIKNNQPTVTFNQTSAGTNINPIYGTINHALWS